MLLLVAASPRQEQCRNRIPFSVTRDSVESACLGVLHEAPAIVCGSTNGRHAFRRPGCDDWQIQRVNCLKAGLQSTRLGITAVPVSMVSCAVAISTFVTTRPSLRGAHLPTLITRKQPDPAKPNRAVSNVRRAPESRFHIGDGVVLSGEVYR
jgi:hypothetical protein